MTDRLLTINIRKYLVTQPRNKRARKAAAYIRDRVSHYTKILPENIRFGEKLNELIFKQYAARMTPVKLKVKIGTDTADVLPFQEEAKQAVASKEARRSAKLFSLFGTKKEGKEGAKKAVTEVKKEERKEEKPQKAEGQKQEEKAKAKRKLKEEKAKQQEA